MFFNLPEHKQSFNLILRMQSFKNPDYKKYKETYLGEFQILTESLIPCLRAIIGERCMGFHDIERDAM